MATITVRRLDDELKSKLRVRAARHGHSMEEEVREILSAALSRDSAPPQNLAAAIRELIEPLGGVDLEIPPRDDFPSSPDFT